jgi:PAS domain S-box-containing protein
VAEDGKTPWIRTSLGAWTTSLAALGAAVALRWLVDPLMGDTLPLVTLFGATAAAVWVGGYSVAVPSALLGYVVCAYLFIPPRGALGLDVPANAVGLVAYLFASALIVTLGETTRRAQARATAGFQAQRAAEHVSAERLLAARTLAAIVESSELAIMSKGLDGVIRSWNAAAERLFGYSAGQAVGRHISLVIPPDKLPEEDDIIARLRAGQRIEHLETERMRSDGSRVHVALMISPIKDEAGNVVGASKIARDITHEREIEAERQKLQDTLRDIAADLAEADRRKDEFLATLSHELRGPLTPLANVLEIWKRSRDPEQLIRARTTMERQLGQIVRLVDDLLDMSRITHDRLELRRGRVQLARIVDDAVDTWRPLAESLSQELTLEVPDEPLPLFADSARLVQVLGNLLSNACKYTNEGGRVSITARRDGTDAVVTVADNGIGIQPDKLATVFDMFTQVGTAPARAQGGLGIGLTLVKRLVEMHGGSVEAQSEGLGRGSQFVVRLPLSAADVDTGPAQRAPPPKAPCRRVLVVDDNVDSATSLAMLLRLEGHETYTAHDGESAIAAAEQHRPDIVLLDIGLPKVNGHDVCRRLRRQPWANSTLMIAVTGWGQQDDRRESEDAGFDGHLVKPVDYGALVEVLKARAPPGPTPRADVSV